MGQSYRIRTELGINKTINVQLDQEFDFLEILSLKLQQEDVYTRSCADYGVLVGRVTANNGLGIPNAKLSVFIPITDVDQSNPIISSIYPYKSPADKNEDGFRYNLLPYEKSYSTHAATGTFPSRLDALTGNTPVEIFDKYYKYTTKTNESGDYMIMGVPLGLQTVVLDVDLSDIGEFSLTPQDLIRIGLATESQVAGGRFKTSNDLNSLPQIISLTKTLEVSPLWGEPSICEIAINRLDFDLRDDANVDIQPTSVFMGTLFSSSDGYRIRNNCRPKDDMGNLCDLNTSPGQILALRQTIFQDDEGNPVLEQYNLEQSGNVIDGDGTWLVELPMNLDYYVTNEFGEKILSNDPTIGIPTKAKYRFKFKWQQPASLSEQTRRAYYLVPNVKEYGWTSAFSDPTFSSNSTNKKKQQSSYYFGLSWSGYTNGFTGNEKIDRLNEIINCDDTFYEFKYNKVYTVASLIDQYKKGGRGNFIGIKEIDDNSCASTVNKFPVNDGFRNFDTIYFLFSILFYILQFIGPALLIVAHIALFLYTIVITVFCALCSINIFGLKPFTWICNGLGINCGKGFNFTWSLPMMTYPECQACDCESTLQTVRPSNPVVPSGFLTPVASPILYFDAFSNYFTAQIGESQDATNLADIYSQVMSGYNAIPASGETYQVPSHLTPLSQVIKYNNRNTFTSSVNLTLGERINLFNQRNSYFTGLNKIKVTLAKDSNQGKFHFDNTICILSSIPLNSGEVFSFISPQNSQDVNYNFTTYDNNVLIQGISGTSTQGSSNVSVNYAVTQTTNNSTIYFLPSGGTITNYQFPRDIEFFQVITGLTISDCQKIWNTGTTAPDQSLPNIINSKIEIRIWEQEFTFGTPSPTTAFRSPENAKQEFKFLDFMQDAGNQYLIILQRGVDPYSPKFTNEYKLGALFGSNIDDPKFTITANTRLNIPIQPITNNNLSVQSFNNQNEILYPSYFFTPGISGSTQPGQSFTGFTSSALKYYGSIDASSVLTDTVTGATGPNSITPALNYCDVSGRYVVSKTSNGFYNQNPNPGFYDLSEDVSGMGIMSVKNYNFNYFSLAYVAYRYPGISGNLEYTYYSKIFPNTFNLLLNNKNNTVLRTDRLFGSDYSSTRQNDLLQQSIDMGIYGATYLDSPTRIQFNGKDGASQVSPDISGLPNSLKVLESFSCENMVGLGCYQGFGNNFKINPSCDSTYVKKGCYLFLRNLLTDIFTDIENFSEWAYRFRFFYGICRGVLSQSFVNNWINGSLYAFPIQVDTFYDSQNKPKTPSFCNSVVYFDKETLNFYYRSSPYNNLTLNFTGKESFNAGKENDVNLLFPTTITDLGYKDSFYSEIIFDPATKAYVLPNLNPTSYYDTSDLVNFFVISRITDENFLDRLLSLGDASLNQLFSRGDKKVDGDLAQLFSINSEIGNISFSPQFYDGSSGPPATILGTSTDPIMAIWYSSTTENLQTKDYLTPGRINFRGENNQGYYPFNYGIKSQIVPFYQWKLANTETIFGNQFNNWATSSSDIVQNKRYQNLDRESLNIPSYFRNTNSTVNDQFARGYIFSVDSNGNYITSGAVSNKFIVGAPFHFYFGVIKGQTALDKFKTKYSIGE